MSTRWGYLRGMHINWGFLSGGYSLGCNLRGVNLGGLFSAHLRRGIRTGFYIAGQSPLSELVEAADDLLFHNILSNKEHVYILF